MSTEGMAPKWLKFLDHTGDAGITVEAPDLKGLFERAAWAMFFIATDLGTVRPTHTIRVGVNAPDRAALLVRWLSQLNYLHVTEHRLFSEFGIASLDERHLEADVSGEDFDPARHTVFTEIKAVTFHDLNLEPEADGWRARIIFDL